jgi:hypothetical protein
VGCGHRSSAPSLRPLLHGTCPCIVACEHICRHYVSPNSHSMRFDSRHFSRSILASISLFLLWITLPWLVRLSMGPLIGLLSGIVFGRLLAHRAFLRLCMNGSSDRGCCSAQQRNGHCRLSDLAPPSNTPKLRLYAGQPAAHVAVGLWVRLQAHRAPVSSTAL